MECGQLSLLLLAVVATMASLLGPVCANMYGPEEDQLIEDLYKRLSELEDDYYSNDDAAGNYGIPPEWQESLPIDSREANQAELRDHEYMEHSSFNDGWLKISGGAGEGEQHLTPEGNQSNTDEVKSDESLPFYCHPPNPCPKGYTEKDGCQKTVADDAKVQKEWIDRMMQKKMCSCDQEHMFDCPKSMDALKAQNEVESSNEGDLNVLSAFFGNEIMGDNPYYKGNKIDNRVAKKSPAYSKRSARSVKAEDMPLDMKNNPYLQGPKLRIVAKKGFAGHFTS